jgi:hypothetical protein
MQKIRRKGGVTPAHAGRGVGTVFETVLLTAAPAAHRGESRSQGKCAACGSLEHPRLERGAGRGLLWGGALDQELNRSHEPAAANGDVVGLFGPIRSCAHGDCPSRVMRSQAAPATAAIAAPAREVQQSRSRRSYASGQSAIG